MERRVYKKQLKETEYTFFYNGEKYGVKTVLERPCSQEAFQVLEKEAVSACTNLMQALELCGTAIIDERGFASRIPERYYQKDYDKEYGRTVTVVDNGAVL